MKAKEKRKVRGYKVADSHYKKAMRRAEREKGKLANIIEGVVIGYASGMNVVLKNSVAPN